jgi:predicted metal-dependent enzyme (double-stranded beta helix superfamily)
VADADLLKLANGLLSGILSPAKKTISEATMDSEFLLDTPDLRRFIAEIRTSMAAGQPVKAMLADMRPHFSQLMADQTWLPDEFRRPDANSGMGGGIATWLLYRAGDGSLSFFALVVPPGASTPIHDHLAWGLVGLYLGEQREDTYEPLSATHDTEPDFHQLRLVESKTLDEGTFYELIPPTGDIHRVTTTGEQPSISLHLLGNDTGCVWRHSFNLETGAVIDFRSGYTNQPCRADEAAP